MVFGSSHVLGSTLFSLPCACVRASKIQPIEDMQMQETHVYHLFSTMEAIFLLVVSIHNMNIGENFIVISIPSPSMF